MTLEKIKPINESVGVKYYDLNTDEANADSLQAGRLSKRAKRGDEEAKKKLDKMMKTPMHREE